MKTTHLKSLLIAAFCLLGFGQAQAQYSKTVEQKEGKFFKEVLADFNLTEVATTLGTDFETLAEDFNKWQEASEENPWTGDNLLFLVDPVDGEVDTYTCDGNGFYMKKSGALSAWGADEGKEGVWYAYAEALEDDNLFRFHIGMSNVLPDGISPLAAGDVATCNIVLKYNSKQATFALTLNVVGGASLPTPTTIVESELNIVGEKVINIEQYPRSTGDSDPIETVIDDLVEKLGADADLLVDELGSLLYCTKYNNAETVADGQGLKMKELTNESTAYEPGYWLCAVMDEGGEYTGECSATGWSDGTERKFYMQYFVFDADTNVLKCEMGQEPGALVKDDSYFVNYYIIYGDKAYRIRYNLVIKEREAGKGMTAYVKKGETTITVEEEPRSGYDATAISINMEAIAETLGCSVSDLKMKALDATENFSSATANNGGFWFNAEGITTSHGVSSSFYIEPITSGDYSTLNVGQYPSALKIGEEFTASLYFMTSESPGTEYYECKIVLKITEPQLIEIPFESVASRTISAQTQLSGWNTDGYACNQEKQIDLAEVESLIGTTTPTLYGWAMDENIIEGANGEYSKAWSCDPKPGFWLTDEGRVSTWGDSNTHVGISYLADGTFRFFQKRNTHTVGDVFKCQLFLVNEDTGDMVTCNMKLTFVEEIGDDDDDATIVGEAYNVLIPMDTEISVPFNLNLAAEALEVSIEDLMEAPCLRGGTNGEFGSLVTLTDGISYNSETFEYDPTGDIYLVFDLNGDDVEVTIMAFEVEEDFSKDIDFCIEVSGKRFIYHAKLVSLQAYTTDIAPLSVEAPATARAIYDLSGRQVLSTQRGVRIQNGKKVVK